jgi:hypothetical protein
VDCDDDNACTVDRCDPSRGCVNVEPKCLCDDKNSCTSEYCDPLLGCVYVIEDCDDNNSYTMDYCDPVSGCVHEDFVYELPSERAYKK